jgi:hypothetical protein
MKAIRKLLRLSLPDCYLLAKSLVLVIAVRLGLWMLPFRSVQTLLATLIYVTSKSSMQTPYAPIDRLRWAVTLTSRYVPRATCLTQALVAKVLLSQCGYSAHVRVGVARDASEQLQAHAWVESEGRIAIGGSQGYLKRYTRLSTSDGEIL